MTATLRKTSGFTYPKGFVLMSRCMSDGQKCDLPAVLTRPPFSNTPSTNQKHPGSGIHSEMQFAAMPKCRGPGHLSLLRKSGSKLNWKQPLAAQAPAIQTSAQKEDGQATFCLSAFL